MRSVRPSPFQSIATGVVRHCVTSVPGSGVHQFQAGLGVSPSQATRTGCAGASFSPSLLPRLRNHSILPQIELTMMSGSPSPSQSATESTV